MEEREGPIVEKENEDEIQVAEEVNKDQPYEEVSVRPLKNQLANVSQRKLCK